ncbi:MAG: HEAT repeat domain-containing protein [Allosphingosinicella sp.]|uniref:HEAT repeat domain-containing protein n=1 Tax=Allosphingosinicella sp. TaxID=2823234 RepID=UPI00394C2E28
MIVDEALAAWLGDKARHARSLSLSIETNRKFRALPGFRRLEDSLAAADPNSSEAVLEAARTFLEDVSAIESCGATLVDAARSDLFFRPSLRTASSEVHHGLLLFDQPRLTIFISVASAEAVAAKRLGRTGGASIVFPGKLSLYKFIKAGGATLSFWQAPEIEPGFSAAGSGTCRRVEQRRLNDGETFALDGRRESFVVDHAQSDMVYLHAATPLDAAPLTVEYDCDSLEFVGASSTDEASSRAQMMLALLRTMDRRDAAPVFEAMLNSPHFYTRWAAMRDFLALDCERALPHLQRMAESDAHPEVREAAGETLAILFPDDQAGQTEEQPCLA